MYIYSRLEHISDRWQCHSHHIIIVLILLGVAAIFKMLSNWKKRSLNIYENPYDYAVPPLLPCITVSRLDSEIYHSISEDF